MMETNIEKQLEIIKQSNDWIKSSLEGNKAKETYRTLVSCRRKLNKKKFALEGNPAAAIYGESQVGKSYLISSLLSEDGKPFSITDENEVVHNFIEKINPPGNGSESTSLVSRFSTNYKPFNTQFPIKAVLLSPADIILVLCDSFYNDINLKSTQTIKLISTEEINSDLLQLKERFSNRSVQQNYLCEDDILNIQDYFIEYFQKADKVIHSEYFEEVSLIIEKAKPNEWKYIFELLWNKNDVISSLFENLIAEFQKIDFAKEAYLPLESVLYAYGTLLDVKRLREIYSEPERIEPKFTSETKLFLPAINQVLEISKSYLCALTAELVFSQSETLLSSKPFLKDTDLLDFPGARSRMDLPLDAIEKEKMPDLLLRGKVAYLFNKYSDAEKINILIFCAKHEQTGQRIIPRLINNWITKAIGDSAEKREEFILQSQISPLFVIGTFFNVNLAYNPQQDKADGTGTPLSNRWLQRFKTTLEKEYVENTTYSWFENWTRTQPDFQNIYLLRDFEKSETPSSLFKGFNIHKKELEEIPTEQYPNFRQDLRQSFIEYDFCKRHFKNPEETWDEAATINRDGTKLIIDRLTVAANNINAACMAKMRIELNEIAQSILNELQKHFRSNDKDEELRKAKNIAGDIQFKLASAFAADKIGNYGQLMKELMIDESAVLQRYRKKLDDLDHRENINLDRYSTYRIAVPVEKDDTSDKYFDRLCIHFEKTSPDRREEFKQELLSNQINLDEIINGNSDLVKNNAQQLAEVLIEYWFEYISLNDKIIVQQILAQDTSLDSIKEMYQKLFKKLNLTKHIAEKIRRYVEGRNKTDIPFEIIADISAELLNKCINSVGFEYLDESEIKDLKSANQQNSLGLVLDYSFKPTENSVEELFAKIENQNEILSSRPEEMKSLPNYRNYLTWSNRLKVGFVSVCDIPSYDVEANSKLGKIIKEFNTIKF